MGTKVVFSGRGDADAGWIAGGLRQRLGADVTHLSTGDLAVAPRWTQHIGPTGSATSHLCLADGRELRGDQVDVLYNRVSVPPLPPLERVVPGDRDYATAEWHACTLSWLATLRGRVINAPHPAALGGDRRTALEWTALASGVGLPALLPDDDHPSARAVAGPRQHAMVVGDRVVGPMAAHRRADELLALRRRSGLDVIGVDFVVTGGRWAVRSVTAVPDLRRGGRPALDALAELFRHGEEGVPGA